MAINLAADLGYGPDWLMTVFTVAVITASAALFYVFFSTKINPQKLKNDKIKKKLYQIHLERYWAISTIIVLGSLLALGYSWSPPIAFENGIRDGDTIHEIKIMSGQWFWKIQDGGYFKIQNGEEVPMFTNQNKDELHVKAGETLKFVAVSQDVTHGFAILKSDKSMDRPLFQMQVVPGYDNVFYYTFKEPGTYTIRCLEYCGWFHPYMTSQITVS
jgi:heme/copper-type cytochrome/quinol oxidase subunit 2